MSLPGADVGRSMSSKEDASEAAKQVAAAAAEGEEVAADEDDPLISATSSMPMAAPADTAFTNKEGRAAAAAKSAKKKKKKGRGDAKVGDGSLRAPVPPPKSGAKQRKKSKMPLTPPPSVQPNYAYDDPEPAMRPLTLPSTFTPRPELVRRLSHSMQSPHDYDLIRSKPARSAIGDSHNSGGDVGDRDFVGIDIENANQRPAWFREDSKGTNASMCSD